MTGTDLSSTALTQANALEAEEASTQRNLRRKAEEYDVLVVSGGGTGCSNLLAKLGRVKRPNEKGEMTKLKLNHLANEDRLKHSYPDRFDGMKINTGIIYNIYTFIF